jgi:hypothetical protein
MSAVVFQVPSGGIFFDNKIYAAASGSIVPGRLVKKASGSTVSPTSSGDTPCGFAFGLRYKVYGPTTSLFADGEELTYVWGLGYCLASVDFFMGGSLPAAAAVVYAGDNGMMTATAASNKKVGVVERVTTRNEAVGGTGSSQSLALIRFDISPYGV